MTINVDKAVCENIEALQFEVESRKDIIVQFLSGSVKMDTDVFAKYHKEYQEYHKRYNKAKQEMVDIYLGVEGRNSNWSLEFSTGELTVEG